MEMTIELDSNDITEIISKHYGVPVNNVIVFTKEECIGYGMSDHYEHTPVATVTVNSKFSVEVKERHNDN